MTRTTGEQDPKKPNTGRKGLKIVAVVGAVGLAGAIWSSLWPNNDKPGDVCPAPTTISASAKSGDTSTVPKTPETALEVALEKNNAANNAVVAAFLEYYQRAMSDNPDGLTYEAEPSGYPNSDKTGHNITVTISGPTGKEVVNGLFRIPDEAATAFDSAPPAGCLSSVEAGTSKPDPNGLDARSVYALVGGFGDTFNKPEDADAHTAQLVNALDIMRKNAEDSTTVQEKR